MATVKTVGRWFMIGMEMQNSNSLGKKATQSFGRALTGIFKLIMKLSLVAVFIAIGLFIGGFFQFTNKVSNYKIPVITKPAGAIVALTGGSARIADALKLLSMQKAARLLISGVNTDTTKSDIVKINASHGAIIKCCVDLEWKAQDTIGNAVESNKWIKSKGYKSIILVTSNYHMPRSLLEFRRVMPDITILPYPVKLESLSKDGWWKNPETLRFMVSEYLKYVGAWSRDFITPKTLSALRASVFGG